MSGKQLPYFSTNLSDADKNVYYTALLTCFKPHRSGELICGAFDLEREYCNFLQSNSGSAQIDMIAFEQKWMEYYRSEDKTEDVEKSQEEILLRTRATSSAPWEPYASDNDGTDSLLKKTVIIASAIMLIQTYSKLSLNRYTLAQSMPFKTA
ncbi:hypothetical protein JG688_00014494 [Phytophthora aleatoria]|uniref:Uncharacterized protein n=1 Tax=Phytophthora aleatoria TaxID=2496075 RepID=A0A8J5MDF2_9STRA|nr:hypothetical protein JG688_00014494 [Phytophthora aleatoria]